MYEGQTATTSIFLGKVSPIDSDICIFTCIYIYLYICIYLNIYYIYIFYIYMYIDVLGKGLTDRLLKYRTTSAINGTIIEMVMFSNNPKTFTKKLNRLMHMHKYIYIYI
jgi:hypothetical protein